MSGPGTSAVETSGAGASAVGGAAGFFTDPTVCIGCKACEVACKEWNLLPAEETEEWSSRSYDHSGSLGASTWRHVKFVEEERGLGLQVTGGDDPFRWLFLSDVCKHCEHAGCLEACPTGAIVRTEVGAVFVQDDVCNGCGYCVVGCPFGVIDRRPEPLPGAGGAFKCTFCYDRQADGLTPACARACPTEAIRFGPLEEMEERARERASELRERGYDDVEVYDAADGSVGGAHALFLVPGEPESFGLPPRPEVPTIHLRAAWSSAALAAVGLVVATVAAFGLAQGGL